jgi:drug/metabolite transporter (DMT)-like permease
MAPTPRAKSGAAGKAGGVTVGVFLGLLVAAAFGSGDFLGGLASRRAPTLAVLCVSQVTALAGAALVAGAAGGHPYGGDIAFGAVAGVLNVAAIGCLYQGLAIGQMGQVAPIAAVIGAVLPVLWGLARGERPGVAALFGIGLAVVAAALLSSEREDRHGKKVGPALVLAAAAGTGFGVSLVLFAAASHHGGFWPVLSARVAALVAVWTALAVMRGFGGLADVPMSQAASAGFLDVSATAILLVALRGSLTAIIAPIASLAPGFTTLHARWYLHEQISRVQVVGLVLALLGLALIATA